MTKLSPTQHRILSAASQNPISDIRNHMQDIKSPAIRDKVIESMLRHGLITEDMQGAEVTYIITGTGIDAASNAASDTADTDAPAAEKSPRVTRNALLLDMLTQGTSIEQIMAATGWQKHSVFGTISNLKKRLGIVITSEKAEGQQRTYKIA